MICFMADDLLVQLLESWISNDKVPDELSIEYGNISKGEDNDDAVIYFRWLDTNREKEFPHTKERYDEVWDRFNLYWDSRNAA